MLRQINRCAPAPILFLEADERAPVRVKEDGASVRSDAGMGLLSEIRLDFEPLVIRKPAVVQGRLGQIKRSSRRLVGQVGRIQAPRRVGRHVHPVSRENRQGPSVSYSLRGVDFKRASLVAFEQQPTVVRGDMEPQGLQGGILRGDRQRRRLGPTAVLHLREHDLGGEASVAGIPVVIESPSVGREFSRMDAVSP